MTKIVKTQLACGTWISKLVELPNCPVVEAKRAANVALDTKAEQEAMAMSQHRRVRPDVQKLGWRPAAR